jgi:hypothetical protein
LQAAQSPLWWIALARIVELLLSLAPDLIFAIAAAAH